MAKIAKPHFLVAGVAFAAGVLLAALVLQSKSFTEWLGRLPISVPEFWYWYAWAVASTSGVLWAVTAVWDKAPGIAESPGAERPGIGLVCMLGAIGGLVRWLHELFALPHTNPGLTSLLWPLESAALSLIVVLILRAGLVSPSVGERSKAVNWLGLYAIAALTGLFANEAVAKLATVFKVLWGKE